MLILIKRLSNLGIILHRHRCLYGRACELLLRARDSQICYDRHSKITYREEGVSHDLFYCIVPHLACIDE
jgi:hypothetical protein